MRCTRATLPWGFAAGTPAPGRTLLEETKAELAKTRGEQQPLPPASERRAMLEAALARRDEISADPARADQSVKAKLAEMFMQFARATQPAAGRRSTSESSADGMAAIEAAVPATDVAGQCCAERQMRILDRER